MHVVEAQQQFELITVGLQETAAAAAAWLVSESADCLISML
jgi:hypothetical protein